MLNRMLRLLLTALTATVVALAAPAYAGVWSSDYDPPEFVGTALFDVPDACLVAADNLYSVGALSGCSVITVLSNVATMPFLIDFAPVLPSNNVNSYVVIGGQLVGVNTGIIGGDVGDVNYWFQFVATFTPGGIESPPSVHNLVNLFNNCQSFEGGLSCGAPIATATQGVTFTRVTSVPEPASLALILAGLGAGWLARKRKIAA